MPRPRPATRLLAAGAGVAALAATSAALGAPLAAGAARGSSCAQPLRVTYVHGRLVGDTTKIYVRILHRGSRYTITWHAIGRARFCQIVVIEGKGQRFTSRNPAAKFDYTDYTRDHTNGIKSLTATARNG
jgi:F0F1-type ATP synthase membrane subunit c/vacuolar-type H+-ATPase subunit K